MEVLIFFLEVEADSLVGQIQVRCIEKSREQERALCLPLERFYIPEMEQCNDFAALPAKISTDRLGRARLMVAAWGGNGWGVGPGRFDQVW